MNIVRFEPWSMIDLINRDLVHRPASEDAQTAVADWVPAVDIVEEKDHFLLQADLPGVHARAATRWEIRTNDNKGPPGIRRRESSPADHSGSRQLPGY